MLLGATLNGVVTGGVVGTPASLPANWRLVTGYLVGPGRQSRRREPEEPRPHRCDAVERRRSPAPTSPAPTSRTSISTARSSAAPRCRACKSGGITGAPGSLPATWAVADGYLVGPAADLTNADLNGADLDRRAPDRCDARRREPHLRGSHRRHARLREHRRHHVHRRHARRRLVGRTGRHAGRTPGQLAPARRLSRRSRRRISVPRACPAPISAGATMTNANATGANLQSADLTGASLANADARRRLAAEHDVHQCVAPQRDAHERIATERDAHQRQPAQHHAERFEPDGRRPHQRGSHGRHHRHGVTFTNATWSHTICPDGTNSDDNSGTCVNNLAERGEAPDRGYTRVVHSNEWCGPRNRRLSFRRHGGCGDHG